MCAASSPLSPPPAALLDAPFDAPLAEPGASPSAPDVAPSSLPDLHQALHELFGFSEFRPLQQEAIGAAVEGRDVLVVMPTGAGKSLCFQLPAAIAEGTTIVVSPLVALMRDQVDALQARTAFSGLGCAYVNSLQAPDEQREVLERLRGGRLKLLYIAPERFRSGAFVEALRSIDIARFVVDEAHCISEWGHDFRPDYLSLRPIVESLGSPPLMAVTATATLRVQSSIVENLGMREPAKFVGGFNRPNLHFAAHKCKNESERQERLSRALPKLSRMGGSGLIYVATRKQCEEVAALAGRALSSIGQKAAAYHAGLDPNTRNNLQSAWLRGDIQVLVATNAFGMGIDKPDVRFVVHYAYPDSIESYYQEAGRAGRDGRKSRCVILHHFADRRTREWFIDNDALTADDVALAHRELVARTAQTQNAQNQNGQNQNAQAQNGAIARVPRGWWSTALGWNEVKARLVVGELERAEAVRRLGENGDEAVLQVLQPVFPTAALGRIRTALDRQRDERYRRLDEMVGYCKTALCRRRTTLSYFGDLERPHTDGFCCDNCDAKEKQKADAAAGIETPPAPSAAARQTRVSMPLRVDGADIHSLLQGLDALHPKVGKARLNKLLRGSSSKDVGRFKAENCPLFGVLRGASEAQADAFLQALIDAALLHQADEDDYFICTVTAAGREAWQMKKELDIAPPLAPRTRNDISSEDESDLFEELRTWRRGEAASQSLPPYCVLSDRALLEVARQKPQNEAALRAITGIGDAKIERYGAALLKIARGETLTANTKGAVSNGIAANGAASNGARSATRNINAHVAASSPVAHAASTATRSMTQAAQQLPDTIVDTYVLLQEGLDIEAVATQRGLQSGTIWSHVQTLIESGFLSDEAALQELIPASLRERIEAALSAVPPEAGLKPVWEKLEGEIDYGPIRCVAAQQGRASRHHAAPS